jgi:hypothetical protein
MKNISTGTGLCVLGLCLASYPIIDRVMPRAEAGATHVAAVVAVATAQVPPEPTIVWYQAVGNAEAQSIFRAWSDGRVEATRGYWAAAGGGGGPVCYFWKEDGPGSQLCNTWSIVSDRAQGLTYRSDINFDSKVNGADLGTLLADWGDAPRQEVPRSTCPLNLINP